MSLGELALTVSEAAAGSDRVVEVLRAQPSVTDRDVIAPVSAPVRGRVEFEHVGCGAEVDVVLRCREGHEVTGRRDVATRPGPGIKPFA